jgi:hypothetical protein
MPWKQKDLRELETLMAMMASPGEITQIVGRLRWKKFEKKFTSDELTAMRETLMKTREIRQVRHNL